MIELSVLIPKNQDFQIPIRPDAGPAWKPLLPSRASWVNIIKNNNYFHYNMGDKLLLNFGKNFSMNL